MVGIGAQGPNGSAGIRFICGLAAEARIASQDPAQCLVSGADPERLKQQLGRLAPDGLRLLVSFGLAAGLDPALAAGDLVIAERVVAGGDAFHTDSRIGAALLARLPGAKAGPLAGVDRPLIDRAAKQACRAASGAIAADMESHHLARYCAAHQLPLLVIRAISDGASQSLPPLARIALGPEGDLRPGAILRSLIVNPAQLLLLPRLAWESRAAFAALRQARTALSPLLAAPI